MSRALVISGGGAKGAFAVGALKRHASNPANLDFDIVAGTSIGAVIVPFVVAKEIALLEQLFTSLKTKDVVRKLNRVLRMFANGYVYNSAELRKRLSENLTPQRAERVLDSRTTTTFFATVCLQTGKVTHFHAGKAPASTTARAYDLTPIADRTELIDAIMASANMPVLMGPIIKAGDRQYVDGGVRAYAPFEVAIDQGASDIWAIVHSPEPKNRPVQGKRYRRLNAVAERTVSLLTEDVGDNDLELAGLKMSAKGIGSHILRPPKDIESVFGIGALEFEPGAMKRLVGHGEDEARKSGW
jgi:predicted acylesterase/phospholipase RssA